ncbi:type II secretion system protein [bacterium]|nr:type II secretion system protein [bacterium]
MPGSYGNMNKYYKFLRKSLIELKKNDGFTLAEVLITLGIIGVVAAMTIPTLIANVQGQRVRSQFKKTLSTLNQAGKMAQAQYDFDFGGIDSHCIGSGQLTDGDDINPEKTHSMCALLMGTLKGASSPGIITNTSYSAKIVSNFYKSNDYDRIFRIFNLADGAIFAFNADLENCTVPTGIVSSDILMVETDSQGVIIGEVGLGKCIGFIDVNGTSLPNKEVTCSDGTAALDPQNPCVVSNKNIGDVIPVVFHDGVVEPATNAGKYLLNTAK